MSGASSSIDPAAVLQRLRDEGLLASTWGNGPRVRYRAHHHEYHKILVVTAGSIVFRLPELSTSVDVRAGDRLELPAGTLHAAEVGVQGVACLEAQLEDSQPVSLVHLQGWVLEVAQQDQERPRTQTVRPATT